MTDTDKSNNDQANNPLHGVKLADILEHLVDEYGFEDLGERITIRCFTDLLHITRLPQWQDSVHCCVFLAWSSLCTGLSCLASSPQVTVLFCTDAETIT